MSKKHLTKEKILNTAAEIVQHKGFKNTSIQDILKASGVPKGSFYYYFDSKEDFGLQLIDYYYDFFSVMVEEFLGAEQDPPLQRLRRFFDNVVTYFEEKDFKGG